MWEYAKESQLQRVIKESVKKVLSEGNTKNIITNCNANMIQVLNNIKNEFDNIYSLLRDGDRESIRTAMKMYNGLPYKFGYEYPYAIGKTYQPLMNAYVKTQDPNNTEYEPEDWHERNEHGDFDSH